MVLKTFGFPIEDFGNDKKKEVVTPEWFYHPLFVTPAIFKPGSMVLKAFGFLIRDFRHDKKKGVIPEWFYEGSKLFKGKCICIGENIRKHSLLHFKKQATLC